MSGGRGCLWGIEEWEKQRHDVTTACETSIVIDKKGKGLSV
jgi:hypothetical protein